MMKEMGYGLCHGEDLNFGKRDASLYNFSTKEKACQLPRSDSQRVGIKPFIPKGKPANYYDQTTIRLAEGGIVHPFNLIQDLKNLCHHISQTHRIGNLT